MWSRGKQQCLSWWVIAVVRLSENGRYSEVLRRCSVLDWGWVQGGTFLRLSPWEMLSAVRKAETRWVMEPASPQWGRNMNVFISLSLQKNTKISWKTVHLELTKWTTLSWQRSWPLLFNLVWFEFQQVLMGRCSPEIREMTDLIFSDGCQTYVWPFSLRWNQNRNSRFGSWFYQRLVISWRFSSFQNHIKSPLHMCRQAFLNYFINS